MEGTLSAIGTESERISIYGIENGVDAWTGINAVKNNGSVISHASITGMAMGLQGYLRITDSSLASTDMRYVLGAESAYFYGDVTDCTISGNVSVYGHDFKGNTVNASSSTYNYSNVKDCVSTKGNVTASYSQLNYCEFSGTSIKLQDNCYVCNILIQGMTVETSSSNFFYSTFAGCTMKIEDGIYIYNQMENCTFSSYAADLFISNNMIGCCAITVTTSRADRQSYAMGGNFWGYDKTREFDEKGTDCNHSFIVDYYDDFNLSKIDCSGYSAAEIEGTGYGTIVTEMKESYKVGDIGPAGGWVFYDKGYYSDGWRYLEAAPFDLGYYPWGYDRTVGTGDAIGTGKANTDKIYKAEASETAAKACMDLEFGGYDDWFLPSKWELNEMYKALKCRGGDNHGNYCLDKSHAATSSAVTRASFSDGDYWSSSELSNGYAWYQNFGYGDQYCGSISAKANDEHVRAVRAF